MLNGTPHFAGLQDRHAESRVKVTPLGANTLPKAWLPRWLCRTPVCLPSPAFLLPSQPIPHPLWGGQGTGPMKEEKPPQLSLYSSIYFTKVKVSVDLL